MKSKCEELLLGERAAILRSVALRSLWARSSLMTSASASSLIDIGDRERITLRFAVGDRVLCQCGTSDETPKEGSAGQMLN